MATIHATCLLVHLICLIFYGASSFGGVVLDRKLWAAVDRGQNGQALGFAQTEMIFGRFAQVAAVFTLLTGIGMLASTNFAQWGQLWLYGKLALFLALGAYGGAVGGRAGRKLIAALSKRASETDGAAKGGADDELKALRSTFATFHVVMPAMLVAVLALATIRP